MTAESVTLPKKGRAGTAIMFIAGLVAVFASAVILTILLMVDFNSSAFFWPMTLMGAVIIACLLAAAALPALKQDGH